MTVHIKLPLNQWTGNRCARVFTSETVWLCELNAEVLRSGDIQCISWIYKFCREYIRAVRGDNTNPLQRNLEESPDCYPRIYLSCCNNYLTKQSSQCGFPVDRSHHWKHLKQFLSGSTFYPLSWRNYSKPIILYYYIYVYKKKNRKNEIIQNNCLLLYQ